MYSNNVLNLRIYDNFKCPYEKSLETYYMHLVVELKQFMLNKIICVKFQCMKPFNCLQLIEVWLV